MSERQFTDLQLERALVDDLPVDMVARVEASPADKSRLQELRAENETFLGDVNVADEVRAIRVRMPDVPEARHKTPVFSWLWLPAAASVAAGVVLWLQTDAGGDDIRFKGDDVALTVHMATESGSRKLVDGDPIVPGDRLRFEVRAPAAGHVAIVGIDAAGRADVYLAPGTYDPQTPLLAGAVELDDVLGTERFFALYSESAFDARRVLDAIAAERAPPDDVAVSEIRLHKKSLRP